MLLVYQLTRAALRDLFRDVFFFSLSLAAIFLQLFLPALSLNSFGRAVSILLETSWALTIVLSLVVAAAASHRCFFKENHRGLAAIVLCKEVSRIQYLASRFFALILLLSFFAFLNLSLGLLLSQVVIEELQMNYALWLVLVACLLLSLLLAGLANCWRGLYFTTSFFSLITGSLLLLLGYYFVQGFQALPISTWSCLALVLQASVLFSGVALIGSLFFSFNGNLCWCFAVFLLGSWGLLAIPEDGLVLNLFVEFLPHWQEYWLSDVLANTSSLPDAYVGKLSFQSLLVLLLHYFLLSWAYSFKEIAADN